MDAYGQTIQPVLVGKTVELRPLLQEHSRSLLDVAADGELWNMKATVVPGPEIDRKNRKLEIGHTWLSRSMQGSGVNTEAKYLLLTH
jgi:hypothetical protein